MIALAPTDGGDKGIAPRLPVLKGKLLLLCLTIPWTWKQLTFAQFQSHKYHRQLDILRFHISQWFTFFQEQSQRQEKRKQQ